MQAYEAMIFHITDTATWANSQRRGMHTGSTRGVDLAEEGYIHCSTAQQWPGVLERFYADACDLVLLHVDEQFLTSPLVYEQLPGAPEPFPHVYGPINLEAVVTVEPLEAGVAGQPLLNCSAGAEPTPAEQQCTTGKNTTEADG
ncbi:MAG: DUF952 domain-containing protein, partial [Actinomycetota bacterium]|nr:DUF952 domain-containing protein [Actinomycetota bacterium]